MVDKIGPYRVYERLGVGGMGEVYKAYDDKLDRWVAIKRIRPDREDAEDNRERFKREARATARLNHPSIVHLYGIFQDGDSDCIVMEYVDGVTLDRKLMNGPLDPLQVATLGHEIASGLAEAHANGILHRDLKAENIIITLKGHSKILDFGLAKPILSGELDPILTGKGQLVGTSRAMSPEYVGGEAIDHRSDLFSLGVLLYECLTGQSPFKAHNTLATLKQVMLHKQTPIREINKEVPQELSDVIDELLAKDPNERPQTAREVALTFGSLCGQLSSADLERPAGPSLLESTSSKIRSTARAFSSSETMLDLRPRRRWMTGLVTILGLLVLAFLLGRFFDREQDVAPLPEGERIRVVLGDFVNKTEESVFDDSLQQAMRVDLEQSQFVEALSPSSVRQTLTRMEKPEEAEVNREIAVEIAQREGAHRVVLGEIQRFGSTYSLLVQVVAPENDATTFSASESARNHDAILTTMQKLTTAVRRHLGESADEISRSTVALEKVTTANFEALRAYTLGEQRMSRQKFDEAVPLFRRAIELDPSFGMAHAKLTVAYSNLGNTDLASEAALEAQKHSERMTEEERFYIDGWVARWLGTPEDVIDLWSLYRDLHPEKYPGHSNLGLSYWYYRNNFEAAATGFEGAARTAQTPGDKQLAEACLGFCRLALGDLAGAEPPLRLGGSFGTEGLVLLASVRGRYDDAQRLIGMLDEPGTNARSLQIIQTSQGLLEAALQTSQRTGSRSGSAGGPLEVVLEMHGVIAEIALRSAIGEGTGMELAIERLYSIIDRTDPYSRNTNERSAPMVAAAVKILARSGRLDEARRLRSVLGEPKVHTQMIVRALIEVADAEIKLAERDFPASEEHLSRSLSMVETITGHDSSAALYAAQGQERAIEEYRWIQERPGLAYVECYLSCSGVSHTVLMWTMASFELGKLLEESDPEAAAGAYSVFVERWSESEAPEVVIAHDRLAALGR
ncbi:MAG: protein kinase [Thermoanaerobaculia bacterium]|nr:protein kinase [Thermoanaerobaculia bacterium]